MASTAKILVWVRWAITAAYWTFLTFELLTPTPLRFINETGLLNDPNWDVTLAAWINHLIAYSILGVLIRYSTLGLDKKRVVFWVGVAFAHAAATEILQFWVPGRFPSFIEVWINAIGISLGVWLPELTPRFPKDRISPST